LNFEFGEDDGDGVGLRRFNTEMPPQFNSDASYESFASLAAYLDGAGRAFRLNFRTRTDPLLTPPFSPFLLPPVTDD